MNYKPILVVAGEPNSIFLEIFFKSLKKRKYNSSIILFASHKLLKLQMKKLNIKKKIKILNLKKIEKYKLNNNSINLINIDYTTNKAFNKISKKSNYYIKKSFDAAFELIKNGISDINSNDFPSFSTPLSILNDIQNDEHHNFKNFINIISEYFENKTDLNLTIKNISSLEINLVTKANYLIEFLKILLKSNLLSEDLSGLYKKYNSSKFNNLKISNLINELNNFRYDYFKVPQINETHVLNYFLSEVKNSIRI